MDRKTLCWVNECKDWKNEEEVVKKAREVYIEGNLAIMTTLIFYYYYYYLLIILLLKFILFYCNSDSKKGITFIENLNMFILI